MRGREGLLRGYPGVYLMQGRVKEVFLVGEGFVESGYCLGGSVHGGDGGAE